MQFVDLQEQHKRLESEIEAAIKRVLAHGAFILGPEVGELEEKLADFVGAKFCITCANGTDALQISLMALDIGPGDEVITPCFSYIAAAESAAILGASVKYIDVCPETYCLDPSRLEDLIGARTKAIIPVSLFGQCSNMREIIEVGDKYGLPVVEDAAQSFGATHYSWMSCNIATISTTSFFPAKPLGCYGDGGAIFTNDENLASAARKIARHGQSNRYYHDIVGVNSRLDTLQASILLEKLKIFPDEVKLRNDIAARYNSLFDRGRLNGELKLPIIADGNKSVWAQYTLQNSNRDEIVDYLKDRKIPVNVYYPLCLNNQKAVADPSVRFEVGESLTNTAFSIPMHPYLSKQDQDLVANAIFDCLESIRKY